VTGWKDSVYTPVYDDPAEDGRALYKIHIQLVPGENRIFLGANGNRAGVTEYRTNFVSDYKAIEDRKYRFHNSPAEEVCTTCHEGLPSAEKGKSMKADCAVCHKTFEGASFLHAPVEMKECASCHTWSAQKKMVVTKKSVPELCFDCHTEKKELVDSAAVQHPPVSECLTCHSPHGTNVKHQLKTDVYTLCTGCHDKYTLNHPVGRHPLRFSKNPSNGEEMSCASCHNPHGSPNPSLLRTGGGRMGICLQCHDK
jgi:predicted CXXCH cytochrome family protein